MHFRVFNKSIIPTGFILSRYEWDYKIGSYCVTSIHRVILECTGRQTEDSREEKILASVQAQVAYY
jgi:hypothetical protein